ncbi:MAG TPA: DUF6443 domain-containing protein, partial [Chitinophagaceae bacterium]|nr:DUF6443 domain-containing protein [Chitinophagaceae bacterium]
MGLNVIIKRSALVFAMLLAASLYANAQDESYIQTIGGNVKKGDSCTVADDKFLNLPLADWNRVQNTAVDNIISFALRNDVNFYYYNKIFNCTLKLRVKYFTSRDQQSPTIIDSVSLAVKYDSAAGSHYPVSNSYRFKNAFKVTVIVDSIYSKEWGSKLPDIFEVRNQILVSRVYPFSPQISGHFSVGLQNETGQNNRVQLDGSGRKIAIDWNSSIYTGATQVDLEWTYIDKMSNRGTQVATYAAGGGYFDIPQSKLEEWMRYDNTRITLPPTNSYTINQHYADGYIIARVRSASVNSEGVRVTSNWVYTDGTHTQCLEISLTDAHEPNLNWQFNGSFAEEGKSKDVISYFDATLRGRQTVTINNSDDKAIAAETIYDNMGRPTLNILPSPVNDNKLKYYASLNLNPSGQPYSHTDITQASGSGNCYPVAANLNLASDGAAKYYSPGNPFLGSADFYFTKYVPDAKQKPFSLTQYMADNTGRVRSQGGVGEDFQPGSGRETKYFYGKPLQSELDRIFGMEVGYNSHYLKNMVVDANGQVSVSYVDAAGKTIATALAGIAPGNMDALPSATATGARRPMTQVLMRPNDFVIDPSQLVKKSVATFMAEVPNATYKIKYVLNPASLGPYNNIPTGEFCTKCYYDIVVSVKNDCGDAVASETVTTLTGSDLQNIDYNCAEPAIYNDELEFVASKVGEYNITYSIQLSRNVINAEVEYYIQHNRDLKTLQAFYHDEMLTANLEGCYSDCKTCQQKLGTEDDFARKMHDLLEQLKAEKYSGYNFNTESEEIQAWIHNTYLALVAHCNSLQSNCIAQSPCEKNLEIIKNDVRPFGQYALVTYNDITDVYSIDPDPTNLLPLYHTTPAGNDVDAQAIYNIRFTDDNGNTVNARNLPVSDFIKAYIRHPEWADLFVKKHVEYCSYLWCSYRYIKNEVPQGTEISASYLFDENILERPK